MAYSEIYNPDNLLTWKKIVGDYTISDLQQDGIPPLESVSLFLSGTLINNLSVSLSWTTGLEAVDYEIQANENGGGYSTIETTSSLNTIVNGLTPESSYLFRIRYLDSGASEVGFSNEVNFNTGILNAPSDCNLTNVQLEQITVNWTSNSNGNEDSFRVERSLTSGSGFSQIASVGSGVTTYVDDNPPLGHGVTYYYRVRAELGGTFSDYSNEANATTPLLGTPTDFAVTSSIYNVVDCSWTSNSEAEEDGFSIERSTTSGSGFIIVGATTTGITTFTDTTADPNTLYYWRVRAVENQGTSDYSNEDSLTTGTGLLNLANPNGDQLTNPNLDKLVALT